MNDLKEERIPVWNAEENCLDLKVIQKGPLKNGEDVIGDTETVTTQKISKKGVEDILKQLTQQKNSLERNYAILKETQNGLSVRFKGREKQLNKLLEDFKKLKEFDTFKQNAEKLENIKGMLEKVSSDLKEVEDVIPNELLSIQ